mmetsp:Transcript_6323/g.14831  ORF Transcript_6323/g.14831 Transcript_6323/m.14831 type:complete len:251 (+) Transcript_6323:376-1128(+)
MASTPFIRKMSTPFSCSSFAIHALVRSMSSSPSHWNPTEKTFSSCMCSASRSMKPGSISSTRCSSKALMFSTFSMVTSAFWHCTIGAYALSLRRRASTRVRSSGETRSTLLRSSLSAKHTCSTDSFSTPSGFSSSRCCSMCLASTSVTMPSSLANSLIDSSMKKVCATGPGSASPVVSMMMASRSLLKRKSLPRMRMRSPRTVQQMHPLFISKMSSSVLNLFLMSESSTPTSPNSFSMTAILFPWLAVRI